MRNRFLSEDSLIYEQNCSGAVRDIIGWGKQVFKGLSEEERLQFAIGNLHDALNYRLPRVDQKLTPDVLSRTSGLQLAYYFQTSSYWRITLLILSYIFMYIVWFSFSKPSALQMNGEIVILSLLWLDIAVQISHRFFSTRSLAITSWRLYGKVFIIFVLTADEIIAYNGESNVLRPFILFRAALPLFYDAELRKNFQSLFSLYKDLFVYILFYAVVIFTFAIVANNFIVMPKDQEFDEYVENYGSLGRTILTFYILSSYDSFPDNQQKPMETAPNIKFLFVGFIFLNFIIFSTVPTSFLSRQFRENHSKQILMSEIRQQHSLVLAFIALSDQKFKLTQKKLLSFLFAVYHHKNRYVGYITKICLQLNQTKSQNVQISDFLQLCKILQSNNSMLPSRYKSWQTWVRLRDRMNQLTSIKDYVKNPKFELIVAIVVFLSIVNCMFVLYNRNVMFQFFDGVFTFLFCGEMIMKIVGFDFEDFFRGTLNKFDFFVVLFMAVFEILKPHGQLNNLDAIFKLLRFYRVPLIGRVIANKKNYIHKNGFYVKTARLIGQIIVIFPIVVKFLPVFAIAAYFLGVLGILIFRSEPKMNVLESPYSDYTDHSNFNSFLSSQFIVIQVLIEAGWSQVALDHAIRYGSFFLSITYFVICHLVIVFVLTSVLKGIVWDVYQTVHDDLNKKAKMQIHKQNILAELNTKKQELQKIYDDINSKKIVRPNTILSRQVIQNKIDLFLCEFMRKMIRGKVNDDQPLMMRRRVTSISLLVDEIQLLYSEQRNDQSHILIEKMINDEDIWKIEDLQHEDIENQIKKIVQKLQLDESQYPIFIWEPTILKQYLQRKLSALNESQRDLLFGDEDILGDEAVRKIKSELNSMMGIKNTKNRQFLNNLSTVLGEYGLQIDKDRVMSKEKVRSFSLDTGWILRQTFFAGTSEKSIKNYEISYFSQVYPNEFSQMIENMSIQPLLRQEANLLYCFKNMLRYSKINHHQFFTQISAIEKKVSSILLKKGSLFKFVYQIDNETDNWFTTEVTAPGQIKVHFIKNSTWLYSDFMREGKVYLGNDFFDTANLISKEDSRLGKKLLKLLFQSFETLALSLENKQDFFCYEPNERIYNLFFTFRKIEKHSPSFKNEMGVSRIMAIILSNEGERAQPFDYDLSNMQRHQNEKKTEANFRFDESQSEMLQKFKKIQFLDDCLNDAKGLPYIFITNFMVQIKDLLSTYSDNFALQVERLINKKDTKSM